MTNVCKADIQEASRLHTNLSVLHAVIGMLESGCIYSGTERTDEVVNQIITLCRSEAANIVSEYDQVVAKLVQQQTR